MARGSIQKRGRSYRARWTDDEGRERQSTHRTRGEAQRALNETLAALTRGDYVNPAAGNVTFAAYAESWRQAQHVRDTSADVTEQRIRLQLIPVLGALPLRGIRRSHVVAVVTRCTHELGLSASVTGHALWVMRAILDAAVADRLITINVARDKTISTPRDERPPAEVLTAAQVGAIAAGIEPRLRALVITAAASGLRPGELFGLTLDRCIGLAEALDEDGRVTEIEAWRERAGSASGHPSITLRVDRQGDNGRGFRPPKSTSSMRSVSVPGTVTATLVDHVRAYGLGPHGLLFTTASGRMISRARASQIWQRATVGLDLPSGATFHALRHFHASSLLSQGVSIAYVSKRLGHANASITLAIYSHAMPRDDEKVLAAAEQIAVAALA